VKINKKVPGHLNELLFFFIKVQICDKRGRLPRFISR